MRMTIYHWAYRHWHDHYDAGHWVREGVWGWVVDMLCILFNLTQDYSVTDDDKREALETAIWDVLESRLEDVIDLDLNVPADNVVFSILVGQIADAVADVNLGLSPLSHLKDAYGEGQVIEFDDGPEALIEEWANAYQGPNAHAVLLQMLPIGDQMSLALRDALRELDDLRRSAEPKGDDGPMGPKTIQALKGGEPSDEERYRAAIEDALAMLGLFRAWDTSPEQIENVRGILARALVVQEEETR